MDTGRLQTLDPLARLGGHQRCLSATSCREETKTWQRGYRQQALPSAESELQIADERPTRQRQVMKGNLVRSFLRRG